MALIDRYNFEDLVNESEHLVLDELEQQLDRIDGGSDLDEDLVLDMAALALNKVQPRYRVNLLGRLYAQNVSAEEGEAIAQAVRTAIERVLKTD
jgi:hypothetical protein